MTSGRSSILIVSSLMLLALGGCIGRREMAARHYETCLAFGFAPNTDYFANCLLQLEMADHGYARHGSPYLGTGAYPPGWSLPTSRLLKSRPPALAPSNPSSQ